MKKIKEQQEDPEEDEINMNDLMDDIMDITSICNCNCFCRK